MAPRRYTLAIATLAAMLASSVGAGPVSLLNDGFLGQGGAPLVQARQEMPQAVNRRPLVAVRRNEVEAPARDSGSLFVGQANGGFFAPFPAREGKRRSHGDFGASISPLGPNATIGERLRHLIGHAEAGAAGYDAINYGAKRLPSRKPTDLTLGEIYAWIDATPGQPHAIGRYQFIPSTLKRLAQKVGAAPHEQFSPRLQDLLANELLAEAGLNAFTDGVMPRRKFMNNLAAIWAGLPNSSGQSHYHGYAGNRATMTWVYFEAEMAKIFPS
jgi:hypothetical protein